MTGHRKRFEVALKDEPPLGVTRSLCKPIRRAVRGQLRAADKREKGKLLTEVFAEEADWEEAPVDQRDDMERPQ